jgi:hypothetical protein
MLEINGIACLTISKKRGKKMPMKLEAISWFRKGSAAHLYNEFAPSY